MERAALIPDTEEYRDAMARKFYGHVTYRLTRDEIEELLHGYSCLAINIGDEYVLLLGMEKEENK